MSGHLLAVSKSLWNQRVGRRLGWDSNHTVCVALPSGPEGEKPQLFTHLLMGKCEILGSNGDVEELRGGPEVGQCAEPTVSYF